ncbi:MAG: hypothetical protein LBS74_01245 [Oscillospiraceae bacterium]|jgi:hypothetical protein|nr:hypothetical protein [Oscillospiraceae bacterium]
MKKHPVLEGIIIAVSTLIVLAVLGVIGFYFFILNFGTSKKPIIYLYPETAQTVHVELGSPERLTHTYPKYEGGWDVIAQPNGDLTDLKTGRSLYALYWEGKGSSTRVKKDGFVVKGTDTISFLEEKLALLGLNEREANEFIIYWLPELEGNDYNYIRFQTPEEINSGMELKISPKPDTLIRIMMEYTALNKPIEVRPQELKAPERKGFTAVEWGGTKIKP